MEEENKQPIETQNSAINLLLFIVVIVLIIICIFVYKSYNELTAIHEILENHILI